VYALNAIAQRLYELNIGRPQIAASEVIRQLLQEAAGEVTGQKFSLHFLMAEWADVVDAWQLETWEAYRDVARLGRKTRLPEKQREGLWAVFERVRAGLKARNLVTQASVFSQVASHLTATKRLPFEFVVVDEAQDLSVAQLRFLAALGADRTNSLFFAGDLGQRIFQQPFSWKALGVDVRGRSRTLHINYRTSHQIRAQADRLLGPEVSDVDGNKEDRRGAISVFNGPEPTIKELDTAEDENETVSHWLADRMAEGVKPHEAGVFVRSAAQLERARTAVETVGFPYNVLDDNVETTPGYMSISTMHLAKGLEFRAVVVMACDDEVIPLQQRIETATDDSELEEVYSTERHLLYVACTRARDHLLVTSVHPASEFLDDLRI
jgi:superfamily I DNA/RNA helicase